LIFQVEVARTRRFGLKASTRISEEGKGIRGARI
jgi:hypothetical protein